MVPSILEAIYLALNQVYEWPELDHVAKRFTARVNEIHREHRISYELIRGEMIPFESKELHQAVIVPTLQLLSGRAGWKKVEQAYQDALGELSDGKPADAITDAGTALQLALEAAGAEGDQLGRLIVSARKKGLLTGHDPNLTDGIEKFMHWASADRSQSGDAHGLGTDARADAWLAVHVVGALILRLADGHRW